MHVTLTFRTDCFSLHILHTHLLTFFTCEHAETESKTREGLAHPQKSHLVNLEGLAGVALHHHEYLNHLLLLSGPQLQLLQQLMSLVTWRAGPPI